MIPTGLQGSGPGCKMLSVQKVFALGCLTAAGFAQEDQCTPCSVNWGHIVVKSQMGCSHESGDPLLPSGAIDQPTVDSSKACPKSTKCDLKMKTLFKREMGDKRIFQIDNGDLEGQFTWTQEKQEEWAAACMKNMMDDIPNRKGSVYAKVEGGNIAPEKFIPMPLGYAMPQSFYEYATERLCAAAGNWGRLRVVRLKCDTLYPNHEISEPSVAYHPTSGSDRNVGYDPMAQAVAHLYIDMPTDNGEDVFKRIGEKDHRLAKTEPINGTFLIFPSTQIQGNKPHYQPGKIRTVARMNVVSEDLFEASYSPDLWHFHRKTGQGPVSERAVNFFQYQFGWNPDQFEPAQRSRVKYFEEPVPSTALHRHWPVAVMTYAAADSEKMIPLFEQAEKKVTDTFRPVDEAEILRKSFSEVDQMWMDRARPFAWYATRGETASITVYSGGKTFTIDCSLGCNAVEDISKPIVGLFTPGDGPKLPPPCAWNYEDKHCFPVMQQVSKKKRDEAKKKQREASNELKRMKDSGEFNTEDIMAQAQAGGKRKEL